MQFPDAPASNLKFKLPSLYSEDTDGRLGLLYKHTWESDSCMDEFTTENQEKKPKLWFVVLLYIKSPASQRCDYIRLQKSVIIGKT